FKRFCMTTQGSTCCGTAVSPPPTPDVQDGLVYADDLPQPTSAIRGSSSSITFDPDYLRLWIPPAGTTGCSVGTAVPPPAYPSGTRVRLCGNIRTAAPWELSTLLRVRNPTGELVFDKRLHIGQEALFLGEVTLDVPGTWELRIGVGEQARRLTLEVQP
ncbi:MAG TPA: hypothetical protein PLA94_10600, partial [Myxococcota bacterium]|nr:hypothetical protein [Myxococcota bacterium]